MDVQIKMPDLATTADEITLIRWLVEVGQPVELGKPLIEIETDKASMEVEAVASGTLKAIYAQAGDQVAVGQVIALIADAADQPVASAASATNPPALGDSTSTAPAVSAAAANSEPAAPGKARPAGSMFARNQQARAASPTAPVAPIVPAAEIKLGPIQQDMARRLQQSKQTIPHYYLNTSANAERLADIREELRSAAPTPWVYWDAFFVQAAARALKAYDRMAYRFEGDRLVRRGTDAIGVAADIDGDLYVIAVNDPTVQSVLQISAQIGGTLARIKSGDPAAKKLRETCLTITNLGAEGIESFQAIINPPESAILAIGRVAPTVQAYEGQVIIQRRVALSLAVDHRVASGKYAAGFLNRIVHELESL